LVVAEATAREIGLSLDSRRLSSAFCCMRRMSRSLAGIATGAVAGLDLSALIHSALDANNAITALVELGVLQRMAG
jgi:hypothetical protein